MMRKIYIALEAQVMNFYRKKSIQTQNKLGKTDIKSIMLKINYRSTPEIINFCN